MLGNIDTLNLIVHNMNVMLDRRTDKYVRYYGVPYVGGKIVLEKYGDTWNLELIDVTPTGQGYGTDFLQHVLDVEHLEPTHMCGR